MNWYQGRHRVVPVPRAQQAKQSRPARTTLPGARRYVAAGAAVAAVITLLTGPLATGGTPQHARPRARTANIVPLADAPAPDAPTSTATVTAAVPAAVARKAAHVPASVALNAELAAPHPGDSPATSAARSKLRSVIASYSHANQQYDQYDQAARDATAKLATAKAAAAKAHTDLQHKKAALSQVVVAQYETPTQMDPTGLSLLTSKNPSEVLDKLEVGQLAAQHQAQVVAEAQSAQTTLDQAQQQVASLQTQATNALADAADAMDSAAEHLKAAQTLVVTLHSDDVLTSASTAMTGDGGPGSAADAAAAMRAQVLATGAATDADFADAHSPAAVISVAASAMLQQAAGYSPAPRTLPGTPAFTKAAGTPVDEQAVMGPAPVFGGVGGYTGTGTSSSQALTPFDGTVSHANWPSAGVGMAGAAPILPADGISVHPILPALIATPGHPVLRAQVAVNAALAELGSPYVWNAAGPDTFDCSGLTLWAWGHAGVPLDHYTGDQVHEGQIVAVNQLLPGDLVLFGADIHHVGMYLGAGYMINAPTTGDYVKIAKVASNTDYLVAVRP